MYKRNILIFIGIICLSILISLQTNAQGRLYAPEGIDGETYYAPFSVDIELDGKFEDWLKVPLVTLQKGVGGPAFSFASAADDEFLYVYADILDGNIISGEHGTNYWNEDSLEVYINVTGDLNLTRYTEGVVQITIPALNRNLPPEEVIISGINGESAEARVYARETDGGWAVELAVPLKNDIWDIKLENEAEIGFQIYINSASELNRDTKLGWSLADPGDLSYQNPSVFGRLIFHEVSVDSAPAGEYIFSSKVDEEGVVDDFESGIWLDQANNMLIGFVPSSDSSLAIQQVIRESDLALPDQDIIANNVLAVTGTFTHQFTDSLEPITLDWSGFNAIGMWLYGDASNASITVGVDQTVFELTDDFTGWQHVIIPFAQFDGDIDLEAVSAYSIAFSSTGYVDDVKLFNVENPNKIILGDVAPSEDFLLDDSITWDSRAWELVWSDEFDAETLTPIDSESWTCEVGGWGWGNDELEYYTDSVENVSHSGEGHLIITAMKGQPGSNETCWYGQCAFTSARCITLDKVEFTYGRVEARIQIPRGQGIWPAFWMLGADFPDVGWPRSGEIDIMENVGHEPQTIHGTVHGPSYSGASGIGNSYHTDFDFADDFHVYAIDWDPNVIRWYVDGELYGIVSINDIRNREWVFNHDFFLIMNVAVGGSWPGFPDETTEFPQQMLADYVRVYQMMQNKR